MPAPSKYTPNTSYTSWDANNPTLKPRGVDLDADFNEIKATTDATIDRLGLLQRDDGKLGNVTVHKDALDSTVLALLIATGTPRGAWLTLTAYAVKDLVSQAGITYIAVIAHTSGVFATDLAAGKWLQIAGATNASSLPCSPGGALVATDVQSALLELDADLTAHAAAVSGTHGISAFGATLTDDADAATARATLGFGTALTGSLTKRPTRTVLLSGSGTYTVPTGCTALRVRGKGAGGGGGGSGAGAGAGGTGGSTTFNSSAQQALGGSGGGAASGIGNTGGGASGGDLNLQGAPGGTMVNTSSAPGPSGGGRGGGCGIGANTPGVNGATNSGGGGGGAGAQGGAAPGGGGGEGGEFDKLIVGPAASYTYAIGAAGTAGAGAVTGGAGGSGFLAIEEFYN
jgi:hypothetical protein